MNVWKKSALSECLLTQQRFTHIPTLSMSIVNWLKFNKCVSIGQTWVKMGKKKKNERLITQLKCIWIINKRHKRNQLEEREEFLAFGCQDLDIEDVSFLLPCPRICSPRCMVDSSCSPIRQVTCLLTWLQGSTSNSGCYVHNNSWRITQQRKR